MVRVMIRRMSIVAALLLGVVAGPDPVSASGAGGEPVSTSAIPAGPRIVVNFASARCLGIRGSAEWSGAVAVVGWCSGSRTQRWHVRDTVSIGGRTYYQWQNEARMCLGVTAASMRSGAAVVQGHCSTTADHSQFWRLDTDGIEHWQNGHSGLYMGVAGSRTDDGAPVVQGSFSTNDTQYWAAIAP